MTVKEQVKGFVHDVKRRISHHKHHRGESSTSLQMLISDGSSQTAYLGPTSRPGSPDGTRDRTPEREFGSQPGPVTPERRRVLSTSSHKHSFFHKLRRKSSNISIDPRSGTPEREPFPGVSQPNTPEHSATLSNPGTPESSLFGHGGARQRIPSTPSHKHNVLHKLLRRKSSHFKSHSDSHAIEKTEISHHTSLKELHEHEDVPQWTSETEPVHDTVAGTAEKDSDSASNPPSIIVTGPPADEADPFDSSRLDEEGDSAVPTEAPLEPAQSQVEEKGDSPQMPLGLDRDTAMDTEEKHDDIQLNPPPVVTTPSGTDAGEAVIDPLEVPLSQVEEKVFEGSGVVVDQDTAVGTEEKHDDIQSNPLPVVATPSGTDIGEVVIDHSEAPLNQVEEEVHEGSGGVVDPPQASSEHGHHSDIHSHSWPIIVTATDTLGSTGEDVADSPEAPLSQDDESEVVVELPHDDNDASDTQHLSGEDVDASRPLQVEASKDVVDPQLAPSDEVPQPAHDIALDTAEKDITPVDEDQSETRSDISGTLISPDSISGDATKVDSDSNSDSSPSAMSAPNLAWGRCRAGNRVWTCHGRGRHIASREGRIETCQRPNNHSCTSGPGSGLMTDPTTTGTTDSQHGASDPMLMREAEIHEQLRHMRKAFMASLEGLGSGTARRGAQTSASSIADDSSPVGDSATASAGASAVASGSTSASASRSTRPRLGSMRLLSGGDGASSGGSAEVLGRMELDEDARQRRRFGA